MDNERVTFDEGTSYKSRKILGTPEVPKMVTVLIKSGIVKTEKQSYYFIFIFMLISLLITAVLVSYYILGIGNPTTVKYSIPPELREQLINNGVQNLPK